MRLLPTTLPARFYGILVLALALAPWALSMWGSAFYLDLLTRILILSIAAASLNLLIGYGGMISLGHAAFIGIGAYCVGIPAYYDVNNGFVHLGLTVVMSALFAFVTGLVSLRTRGVYFIMITLAFAQMLYFILVSLEEYGADDGLLIYNDSDFGDLVDINQPVTLYYAVLGTLLVVLWFMHRLVNSRFGRVIAGSKFNEARMQALGYDPYRYKLACYVISGVICGLAGFFLGNFTNFISPEMMNWIRSGELIFMIIIGGAGVIFGPVIGTIAFLLLEEYLSGLTQYWHLIFGLMLIALVLFGKGGLHGFLVRLDNRRRETP